jgi:hypothetical protein
MQGWLRCDTRRALLNGACCRLRTRLSVSTVVQILDMRSHRQVPLLLKIGLTFLLSQGFQVRIAATPLSTPGAKTFANVLASGAFALVLPVVVPIVGSHVHRQVLQGYNLHVASFPVRGSSLLSFITSPSVSDFNSQAPMIECIWCASLPFTGLCITSLCEPAKCWAANEPNGIASATDVVSEVSLSCSHGCEHCPSRTTSWGQH